MSDQQISKAHQLGRLGFGCVRFRPKKLEAHFPSFAAYVERLSNSLKQIAAIQNIDIFSDDSLDIYDDGIPKPFSLISEAAYPSLSSGAGCYLDITLSLNIPDRTQREILEIDQDRNWHRYEVIEVHFKYQFEMPLMVVFLPGESSDAQSPSECVRLVRMFLASEMENNANSEFTLDVLGPSPFHVDFTLYKNESLSDGIGWERRPIRGYDEVDIALPSGIETFEEIIDHLDEHLFDDFDAFYMLMIEKWKVSNAWHDCLAAIAKYEDRLKSLGRFRRGVALLWPTFNAFDLFSQIADFRIISMYANGAIRDRISESTFIKASPIWTDIKKERRTFPQYDIDSLEKLANFIDSKQTHRQDIANTVFAAITGGVAGAIVAWLMHSPT